MALKARLTVGGICSYGNARRLMDARLGKDNAISQHMIKGNRVADGRARYAPETRERLYRHIIGVVRDLRPDLPIALCLEERALWEAVHPAERPGVCNCVL